MSTPSRSSSGSSGLAEGPRPAPAEEPADSRTGLRHDTRMHAKKIALIVVALAALGGGAWYYKSGTADPEAAPAQPTDTAGGARGGRGGRSGGLAMTVESASVSRHDISEAVTVVGNLIGEATVDVVP